MITFVDLNTLILKLLEDFHVSAHWKGIQKLSLDVSLKENLKMQTFPRTAFYFFPLEHNKVVTVSRLHIFIPGYGPQI